MAETETPRTPGFYWVRLTTCAGWEPAQLCISERGGQRYWLILGSEVPLVSEFPAAFEAVGERIDR